MNGLKVGEYGRSRSGANTFSYDDSWLASPGRRSISLSLPLRSKAYAGPEVYNYFDNLLPDSREIRERIVARFQADSTDPFDLLTQVGRDCVGAIQLLPHKAQPPHEAHLPSLYLKKTSENLEGVSIQTPLVC